MSADHKTCWIECECGDYDCASRIEVWHDEADNTHEFYFSYQPEQYPKYETDRNYLSYINGRDNWHWFQFKCWLRGVKLYFRNIWYAITGKPQWWYANMSWGPEQAKKLSDFIRENLPDEPKVLDRRLDGTAFDPRVKGTIGDVQLACPKCGNNKWTYSDGPIICSRCYTERPEEKK
jgi:hypothetical protein